MTYLEAAVILESPPSEAQRTTRSSSRAVLSGSFARDSQGLALAHKALCEAGCEVLSPLDPHFVTHVDGFVLAAHEVGSKPSEVEQRHLEAIRSASFVWLHDPEGYVGPSASLEVGYAYALGVPIFCAVRPEDPVIASMVVTAADPGEAVVRAEDPECADPGRSLRRLQRYYEQVALERGYQNETARDTMLLLTEEVGELARAVRKDLGLARSGGYGNEDIAEELADIQLYLLHLANVTGVDLASAVTAKEERNAARAAESQIARSA